MPTTPCGQELHAEFTEEELVELGYWIGFTFGGQRWLKTLGSSQGQLQAAIDARGEQATVAGPFGHERLMHPADISGFRQLGQSTLGGYGDGMQVMRTGEALYVAHFGPSGMGTSVLDVSDPTDPGLVFQMKAPEGSHTHKVQLADGLLLTNHEAFRGGVPDRVGMAIYDTSDPFAPTEIGFWDSTGLGVHRIVYEGGQYAYVSARPDGFPERIWVIVDVSDPEHPVERARWWWPGMHESEHRTGRSRNHGRFITQWWRAIAPTSVSGTPGW